MHGDPGFKFRTKRSTVKKKAGKDLPGLLDQSTNYRLSLRRNKPTRPITPEPNNTMLPGSGVVEVL